MMSELWHVLQANPKRLLSRRQLADPTRTRTRIQGMIVAIMINKYLQAYPRTISTNVTEGRMKTAVKTKANLKKTNNQASFGGSILKANMEVEAAIELAHDLDETSMPCVFIGVGLLGVLLGFPERG